MDILCVSPHKHSHAKVPLDSFYRALPNSQIVESYTEALSRLRAEPSRFDGVVTTMTPNFNLRGIDGGDSSYEYDLAHRYIRALLSANRLGSLVVYSGADPKSLSRVLDRFPHQCAVHKNNEWSASDREQVLTSLTWMCREYRIDLVDDRLEVVESTGRRPFEYAPTDSSLVIPVRLHVRNAAILDSEPVAEFEYLINKRGVTESELQRFLEAHTEFLLGDRYKSVRSQVHLRRDTTQEGDLIPDFILEPLSRHQFWKLLELKLPNETIVKGEGTNRPGFTAKIHNAHNQLRRYRDFFDDSANRQRAADLGIHAFKPEMSVVIGRNYGGMTLEEVLSARAAIPSLEVITYAELLKQARRGLRRYR